MNLDDVNFAEEWEEFKQKIGHQGFVAIHIGLSEPICVDIDNGTEIKVNKEIFRIWMELGLVQNKSLSSNNTHRINPKELCPESNPSIQSDEK